MRVRDDSDEDGSLKPMWPFVPMPRIWMSMPPAERMACSYLRQAAGMSVVMPSGMLIRSLGMLRLLKRWAHM